MDHPLNSSVSEEDLQVTDTPPPKAKTRSCLRCDTRFMSSWSGERICPRCKGSSAWRNDVPISRRHSS